MADLTTQVLIDIRDEIRATKDEIRATKEDLSTRIDETNDRLGRLERRQTESEVRLTTEIVAVAGVMREVRDAMLAEGPLRRTVDDHEHRIRALESTRG